MHCRDEQNRERAGESLFCCRPPALPLVMSPFPPLPPLPPPPLPNGLYAVVWILSSAGAWFFFSESRIFSGGELQPQGEFQSVRGGGDFKKIINKSAWEGQVSPLAEAMRFGSVMHASAYMCTHTVQTHTRTRFTFSSENMNIMNSATREWLANEMTVLLVGSVPVLNASLPVIAI